MNFFLTTKIPALPFITDTLTSRRRTVDLHRSASLTPGNTFTFIAALAMKFRANLRHDPRLTLQTPQGLLAKSTITRLSLAALALALSKRQPQYPVLALPTFWAITAKTGKSHTNVAPISG
jgi:hypothetical protein